MSGRRGAARALRHWYRACSARVCR